MYVELRNRIKYFFGNRQLHCFCNAFETNIYFRVDGYITPCSANSIDVFGKYPDSNLKEIIEGPQRKKMIADFLKGNIPKGCINCYNHLKNGSYESATFNLYNTTSNDSTMPVSADFELSNHCNLKCIMCNPKLSDKHLFNTHTTEGLNNLYDSDFVSQLIPYLKYLKKANFKGGEPFLIKIYYLIWHQLLLVNKDVRIGLTTNGTILNENVKDLILSGNFHLDISLDSLKKDTFEFIRQNASYDVFFNNILYFRNYCKSKHTDFNVSTCIMNVNYMSLPDIFLYAEKNNFNVYINYVVEPQELSLEFEDIPKLEEIKTFLQNCKPTFSLIRGRTRSLVYNSIIKQIQLLQNRKNIQTENTEGELLVQNSVYNQIVLENDEKSLEKVKELMSYLDINNLKQFLPMAIDGYTKQELISIIHDLSYKELIEFIENEIHSKKNS